SAPVITVAHLICAASSDHAVNRGPAPETTESMALLTRHIRSKLIRSRGSPFETFYLETLESVVGGCVVRPSSQHLSGVELEAHKEELMRRSPAWSRLSVLCVLVFLSAPLFAQETTGGLQGTIKDPTGAVVPGASIEVASPALIG